MRRRITANTRAPNAATEAVIIRPFFVKKVNSKKLRVNGMRNTATIIPIMVRSKIARSGFRGFEIQ